MISITNHFYSDSRDSRSNTGSRKSSSEEISDQRGGVKETDPEPPAAISSPKANPRESPKTQPNMVMVEETGRREAHDFNLNLEEFLQLDSLPLLTVSSVPYYEFFFLFKEINHNLSYFYRMAGEAKAINPVLDFLNGFVVTLLLMLMTLADLPYRMSSLKIL